MATREELYRKWGPMLFEAVVLVDFDEHNRIREWLGKPLLTEQDVLNAVDAKLKSLPLYGWMDKKFT